MSTLVFQECHLWLKGWPRNGGSCSKPGDNVHTTPSPKGGLGGESSVSVYFYSACYVPRSGSGPYQGVFSQCRHPASSLPALPSFTIGREFTFQGHLLRCLCRNASSHGFTPRIGLQRLTRRKPTFMSRFYLNADRFFNLLSGVGHISTRSTPLGCACLPASLPKLRRLQVLYLGQHDGVSHQ